jgi:hypothetical protein
MTMRRSISGFKVKVTDASEREHLAGANKKINKILI